jgi:ParB/RepB/Spo0J family partition protein
MTTANKKALNETKAPDVYPVTNIPVKSIDPSPANKRRFQEGDPSIQELAVSIETKGLLQAIIVRDSPAKKGRYELVAGERRWRAFQLKGWKEIPAVIRELTDIEAHDITATENIQREDLTPIEESETIQVMLDDGRDAKEIADKFGKPVSWVVRRARIADLSPKWIKAISDPAHPLSKWSATHLELIARYDHAKQDELFGEFGDRWDSSNALMTVRDLEKQLSRDMLNLSSAPWKPSDETLLPAVGACTQCQKRTSCAPSLFEPIEDAKSGKGDRCLDRECWGRKLMTFHELNIKKAREEHKNLILIDRADSERRMLPPNHGLSKMLVEAYKYEAAKKGDKAAVPAYVIDGPGSGQIRYMKMQSWYGKSEKARPIGEDGKPAPKPMKERREGLEKRRIIRFVTKLMMILQGEDPDGIGAKSGTCRICGCTEENCTQCVEKTGKPCTWVDREKTLCSACEAEAKKGDQRVKIAESISNIEAFALVSAFGAGQLNRIDENALLLDDDFDDFDRWKVYKKVCALNGMEALIDALFCVFDRIIDQLRQLTYAPEPQVDFANHLCAALRLDREAIWNKCVEEIPEPKAWANLKADGTKKAAAAKKKSKYGLTWKQIAEATIEE